MVTGQKVRWVLDLMRGTEFAGRTDHDVRGHPSRARRSARRSCCTTPGPATSRIDLTELASRLLALGEPGHTMSLRHARRAAAARAVRHRRDRGLRLVVLHVGRAADRADPTRRRDGACGRPLAQRAPPRRGRPEHDGTYTIDAADGLRVAGLGRLVDGGDGGDTYNYSPPDDRPRRRRARLGARRRRSNAGPVRARVAIDADYTWPDARDRRRARRARARSDADRCASRSRTTLELRAGERFLRVAHELDNRARDHRLRAHFPLPAPVDGSDAECAFAVVHRGLTAEGGAHEFGLPTFASRRFVDASDGDRRARARARRPARVRGRRRRHASSRSRSCGRSGTSRGPSRRCARIPAGPTEPLDGPQLPGPATRRVRGAAAPRRLARRPTATPPPTRSSSRSNAPAAARPGADPTAAAAPRCGSTGAEVSAVLRVPGGAGRARLPHRRRRRARHASNTRARPPRLGHRPPRPARRAVRRHASTSARGRSAPSNSRNLEPA